VLKAARSILCVMPMPTLAEPPPARMKDFETPIAATVTAAAAGDPDALARLVRRYERTLRGVTRFYRLSGWDADDVIQATWLQFLQHGHTLRDPAAAGAWLTTTARRQCLGMLQQHMRELPDGDPALGDAGESAELDGALLGAERRTVLGGALRELPERHRALMTLLVTDPDLSYDEVGRRLEMPIGSIGPIRARSLERLRRHEPLRALHAAGM
jgi:RNA polymerase sigma factor (sigma-70 family)